MKVLHFYKTSYPSTIGGVEQVIHSLARGSQSHGVFCDVLSLSSHQKSATQKIDGYQIHYAHQLFEIASTGFSLDVIPIFKKLAQSADIIHYHYPWPFMDLVHFLVRPSKPTVVSYHSDVIRQKHLLKLYNPLKHKFLSDIDVIVASSPNYLNSSEDLNRYREKVRVIPYGLERESYKEPTLDLLKKWKSKVGDKFFLFIGVLRYYKGLHTLIDAAKGLNLPIVIVGTGPMEESLREQAGKLGLKHIYFLGAVSERDKVALIKLCYSVIFPSHLRSEAFGITLLEGLAFGKPLISCEIGTGTTFVNIKNETGLVIPPNDVQALRDAMQYLWDHPKEAFKMEQAAEKRYWKYFTADKMVRSYIKLYKSLLN